MVSSSFMPREFSPDLPFSSTKQDFTPLLLLIIVSMTTVETPRARAAARLAAASRAAASRAATAAADTHEELPSNTKSDGQAGTPTHALRLDTHACPGQQQFTPSNIRSMPAVHDDSSQPLAPASKCDGQEVGSPTHALPVQPCPGQQQRPYVSMLVVNPAAQPALVDN